jgi:23S rRNA (cytidine1920-2'-O)/16S rRNA (cytidine1409-2'-O)-methyltransferase
MTAKKRLDVLLVERGLAETRSQAQALVLAGRVKGHSKAGEQVDEAAELELEEGRRFVSRGGEKLAGALEELGVDVAGEDVLDVGASTGGFTDCLLQHGAARVIALDVAYGQLDWRLRQDPRVAAIERANARRLRPADLPFAPELATVDVSFISLAKVLPAVAGALAQHGELLALVKPQFELSRQRVGSGGVVRGAADRRLALVSVARTAQDLGLHVLGFAPSGLPGPKGNRETFAHCALDGPGIDDVEAAAREADP